jgi:protein ImuB
MVITSVNNEARKQGINKGMVVADAMAILPDLQVLDDKPDLAVKLLTRLSEWCMRFSPVVAIDPPDGLILDASGCCYLWGGEENYLAAVKEKLGSLGYEVRLAMANTIGLAWGMARFTSASLVVSASDHLKALRNLPPEGLRLEADTIERLHKLGLHQIGKFIKFPRNALRKRFGAHTLIRLDMAMGQTIETIVPVQSTVPYQERLPCMEPIVTATGILIALHDLLERLCHRLRQEQKGLREAIFKCFRVDGKVVQIKIVTNRPSYHVRHLSKLFANKLTSIEPDLGIELFVLDASKVEDHFPVQEQMWSGGGGLEDIRLSELVDNLAMRLGEGSIFRCLPDEHYWPERSCKMTTSLSEKPEATWPGNKRRPFQILQPPEVIEVTAPIPDYPPMLFRYQGKLHTIIRADGPERIEQEWWLQQGQHRDYYCVEDEEGGRYWLFRLGHYQDRTYRWYMHGFFS